MRHVKVYDEKIPAEVLITHTNGVTGKKETHHYCFKTNKAKTYLKCYMLDGNEVNLIYVMLFVLSNTYLPMTLAKFLKLKTFL
jgi:hypothetical protein